ncbi:MAG TPA: nucleotidyltransferase family protein [Terrimicrobiaceae bacterium]|nr:nucleotidyltransferase family protein [Terrimicrobiaceae bacterium]
MRGVSRSADERIWQGLQVSQAAQALAVLAKAKVPCLLLKGAAGLAAGWFESGERPLTDVDVLVPPGRLSEAIALLGHDGWSVFRAPSAPDARRHSQAIRSPWGFLIDLHWFALRQARWSGADDLLWRGAMRARLGDAPVLIPCAEDFLVHTIAHGLRRASSGARWKEDVQAVLGHPRLPVNWARVIKASENYRVTPLVARALEIVAEELPSKVPRIIREKLHRARLPWSDRLFLQLTTDRLEEAGLVQALVLVLDFLRTRPMHWSGRPNGFIDFLKDRWELRSRAAVPGQLAAVAAWGLQSEVHRGCATVRDLLARPSYPAQA